MEGMLGSGVPTPPEVLLLPPPHEVIRNKKNRTKPVKLCFINSSSKIFPFYMAECVSSTNSYFSLIVFCLSDCFLSTESSRTGILRSRGHKEKPRIKPGMQNKNIKHHIKNPSAVHNRDNTKHLEKKKHLLPWL